MFSFKLSYIKDEFYKKKIENIAPTFKQLFPLQTIGEFMTSTNYYVNIHEQKSLHLALINTIILVHIKPMS